MTDREARRIANWVFRETCTYTEGGEWDILFNEIENWFNVKLTKETAQLVVTWLEKLYPNAVLDIIIGGDHFEVLVSDWYFDCDDPSVYEE